MGAAKPCLGYPSRTAAVLALRSEGHNTRSIALRLDIPVSTVSALEGSARRSDRDTAPAAPMVQNVAIEMGLIRQLRSHAARRRISVNRLITRLLEEIAEGDLVDAVLDDGEDCDAR